VEPTPGPEPGDTFHYEFQPVGSQRSTQLVVLLAICLLLGPVLQFWLFGIWERFGCVVDLGVDLAVDLCVDLSDPARWGSCWL
jgi:hypothetical protein